MTRASVAIKIIVDDRISPEALKREWQLAIRLMHAHIVRVFEFHDDDDAAFYSLQFIDGPDISVLSGADPSESLPPLALIADALRYAHAKDVVHRDIKAANIMLDRNGAPYLVDFGVASTRGTSPGGGSLIAASPQQLAGETPQPADDIFALGGLIYELVSGSSPWGSATTADDIRAVEPPPLRRPDGSDVPPALQALVARMLDKDALMRPTAEEVKTELAAIGFAPAPAPARFVASARAAGDELIETRETVQPVKRHRAAAATETAEPSAGISPRVLGIGLAVLLLILIGVVFLLPKTVTRDGAQPVTEVEQTDESAPTAEEDAGSDVEFNENIEDLSGRDRRVQDRGATEEVLGELLSKMDILESRAVQRWGGLRFARAQAIYAEGDEAYLARDYATASEKYREAIDIVEPLLDEVEGVFRQTFDEANVALEEANAVEAVRLFELAVAISPGYLPAQDGLERARNLDEVLSLIDQGLAYEKDLELDAARQSLQRAVELDPEWEPARTALDRILATIKQMEFDQRMTEGLTALAEGDYLGARAAFRMAQQLKPGSPEPADGMMQVDQGLRLANIASLEQRAQGQEQDEQWAEASATYESILELDGNLAFAQDGLDRTRQMETLHSTLEALIADPDSLSRPSTMQSGTRLLLDITRMEEIGPRLAGQRDELSRLLKRAATPLTVKLVSDSLTDVSIYKVGKLGSFDTHELSLRPGTYVAVGVRAGYRDVRLEFRVAPEIDMQPIVVRCEEQI